MSHKSCSEMPSRLRRLFAFRDRAAEDAAPVRRSDFHKAAMLAASGSYAAEDYEMAPVFMDVDAVN